MDKIFTGFGKEELSLHHAYLIAGNPDEAVRDILAFLEKIAWFEMRGNPDLYVEKFGNLTVDDSRRLKEIISKKPIGKRKAVVVSLSSATVESQNALLKALEEPSENTHVFLIVPRVEMMLPTIRSRAYVIDAVPKASREASETARTFAESSISERMKISKKIADAISDGESDKNFAVEFIGELERMFREKMGVKYFAKELQEVMMCRKYIFDRSASIKMLLEHIALVLPVIKL